MKILVRVLGIIIAVALLTGYSLTRDTKPEQLRKANPSSIITTSPVNYTDPEVVGAIESAQLGAALDQWYGQAVQTELDRQAAEAAAAEQAAQAAQAAASHGTSQSPSAAAPYHPGTTDGACSGFAIPDYIIQRESGGNPSAYNPSGAYGCAQTLLSHYSSGSCQGLDPYTIEGQRACVDILSNGGTNLNPWALTR